MPGYAQQMADFGGQKQLSLGPQFEAFIDSTLLDFTHMTVLLYMVRHGRDGCSPADIAGITGDSKRVVQKVLQFFEEQGLVRSVGGLLSKKYVYEKEGRQAQLVFNLLKLWEHKQTHELVLRRILAPSG